MKKAIRSLLLTGCLLLVVFGSLAHAYAAPASQHTIATDDLTISLGDGWQTSAKLTYPADAAGPLPTVILVHGSGPHDMDHTLTDSASGQVISANFKTIAESLSASGAAVLRFNKRYVTNASTIDGDKFSKLTLPDLLSDLEMVLTAAKANRRVDPKRIFIYAWSEGTLLGAALAAKHPELAGLILQGAIASTDRQTYIEDYADVILPYLRGFAPDGRITSDVLSKAQAGNGGLFVKGVMFDLIDPSSTDTLKVSPFFDANGDGVLDIDSEVTPRLGEWVDSQLQPGGVLAFARQMPSVSMQAANIRIPVLVLQGENDVAVRIKYLPQLEQALAGNKAASIRRYPGLGHGLEPTASIFTDNFGPIAAQPLADIAAWISAPASAPRALPATGGQNVLGSLLGFCVALLFIGGGLVIRQRQKRST